MRSPLVALIALAFAAVGACAFAPATAVGRILLPGPQSTLVRVDAPSPAHVIARVRTGRVLTLRSRLFGPVVARVGDITRFGSRRALGVVTTRRGRWLAVTEAGIGWRFIQRVLWAVAFSRSRQRNRICRQAGPAGIASAIHGTLSPDFGRAVSAGCLHARDGDLHYLMHTVPLGTPVLIRP